MTLSGQTPLPTDNARFLELLSDVLPNGIYFADASGNILYANDKFHELTGMSRDHMLDEDWNNCIHPDDLKGAVQEWDDAVTSGVSEAEYRYLHKDGSICWVLDRAMAAEWDGDGHPLYMIGTLTDITDVKQRELDLNIALEKADAAALAKSEFLANMSHEIRTPMNGVLGMAEILSNTGLDEKQHMCVETISKSGSALITIINDILDFAKVEAGKLELDPLSFDLRAAVEDVATLLASQAEEKNLELVMRCAPDLPETLVGDAGRIRQIITNLVGNAVKFTTHGHVFLDVDVVEQGQADGVAVKITVADTGSGIPEGRLSGIFDKFEQVDNSTTRLHGGTGLGLAISKRLVELMDGSIGVSSVEGEGSAFWFAVTLTKGDPKRGHVPLPCDLTGRRLLVVDDIELNRRIVHEQATAWGMEPVCASAGLEALDLMREAKRNGTPFDIAILDFQMPNLDGGQLAQLIRAEHEISDVPLVLLTSVGQQADGKKFRDMGVEGHLLKPARAKLLQETVAKILSENDQRVSEIAESGTLRKDTPARDQVSRGMGRILLAEDNQINQFVVQQMLEGLPIELRIADNGRLALESYREEGADIVLMDVSMPEMDGYEATRSIREFEAGIAGRRVPIIGLTAHVMENDRKRCLDAGMDDYLPKPIALNPLRDMLFKWIQKSKESDLELVG